MEGDYSAMEDKNIIKILYIENDEEDYEIIKEIISDIKYQKYEIIWISSYEKAVVEMRKDIYDLFLIDQNIGVKKVARLKFLLGISKSESISSFAPRPLHDGHAP